MSHARLSFSDFIASGIFVGFFGVILDEIVLSHIVARLINLSRRLDVIKRQAGSHGDEGRVFLGWLRTCRFLKRRLILSGGNNHHRRVTGFERVDKRRRCGVAKRGVIGQDTGQCLANGHALLRCGACRQCAILLAAAGGPTACQQFVREHAQ